MTQVLQLATAINNFVVGCKADGIWDPIKACCIMGGWDGLSGALYPLKGAAPTNFNFVSGDYDRKTGLVGNGTTKYLDSNRNNNADPQNSCHQIIFASTVGTGTFIGVSSAAVTGSTGISATETRNRCNTGTAFSASTGFNGTSRALAGSYSRRTGGATDSVVVTSQPPGSESLPIFARPGPTSYSNARLAFYSIGESLDLALLDARVTTLINAFAAAIP